ncbi:MAG TPA: SDR family NAD(P)-dependent oxidoreductase [Solirubrobacteraceae bacterium]|jgi:NAD(P)-dependent dehydrogenase (short-subunit alcohol dehydrogenase family)
MNGFSLDPRQLVVRSPITPPQVARRLLGRSLEDAVRGKLVLITGASSGIGRAAALKVGAAGGEVALVARTREKLDETRVEIAQAGGTAFVHPCDLSDLTDIDRMAAEVLEQHGRVDVLVNNAGRSIRRSIALSYDRFHDFERTMQLNYFGPVRLILRVLPGMRERRQGHVVNISSVSVQTGPPRFAAYMASKAALDAFSDSVNPEIAADDVQITTIYMPLVRTPMIAPTEAYARFPTLTPDEAADLIGEAITRRPRRISSRLGNAGELTTTLSPGSMDAIARTAYRLFPDSRAARGGAREGEAEGERPSRAGTLFANLFRGGEW